MVVNGIPAQSRLGIAAAYRRGQLSYCYIVIAINVFVARKCGFNKADEITIVSAVRKPANDPDGQIFCFRRRAAGMMVLPLMIFHQIQLMVCAGWRGAGKRQTGSYRRSRKAAPRKRSGRFRGCTAASALGFALQQRDLHQLPSFFTRRKPIFTGKPQQILFRRSINHRPAYLPNGITVLSDFNQLLFISGTQ